MVDLLGALGAVVAITAAAALLRRAGLRGLCPLCAGVAATWLALLGLAYAGRPVDPTVTALLLGASAVGLAYAVERRVYPETGGPLPWKTAVVVAGLAAGYGLLHAAWPIAVPGALVLLALVAPALWGRRALHPDARRARSEGDAATRQAAVADLTQRMKNCC